MKPSFRIVPGTSAITVLLLLVLTDTYSAELTNGRVYANFNMRYESVEEDNDLMDADALTLRTRFGYETGKIAGLSALIELEDSRAGIDDYNDGLGSRPEYSTVVDPETTELDQAYLKYDSIGINAILGRQIITYDNQRHVGHVGWRQDRQTFDALSGKYLAGKNLDTQFSYSYIDQRNRIFAKERDVDSKDHLFNVGYTTTVAKISGYAYLLEEDTDEKLSFNTFGVRFSGSQEYDNSKSFYSAEYATQENSSVGAPDFRADYYLLEGGLVVNGITGKIGYEVLGSDSGAYGFSTPLATLHGFNGWADKFLTTPTQGLIDLSLSVSGQVAGGNWLVVLHDFEADESSSGIDDLGDEINLSYSRKFATHYTAGIKYASYSAGDINADTDKFWVWFAADF